MGEIIQIIFYVFEYFNVSLCLDMENTVFFQQKEWKSQTEILYPAPKANANILQTDLEKGTAKPNKNKCKSVTWFK